MRGKQIKDFSTVKQIKAVDFWYSEINFQKRFSRERVFQSSYISFTVNIYRAKPVYSFVLVAQIILNLLKMNCIQ